MPSAMCKLTHSWKSSCTTLCTLHTIQLRIRRKVSLLFLKYIVLKFCIDGAELSFYLILVGVLGNFLTGVCRGTKCFSS